jgi:hypothetical protein
VPERREDRHIGVLEFQNCAFLRIFFQSLI